MTKRSEVSARLYLWLKIRSALAWNAARDNIQTKIRWVLIGGQFKPQAVEIGQGSCARPLENCPACLAKEQNLIKEDKDAIAWLMDYRHNGHAQICHPAISNIVMMHVDVSAILQEHRRHNSHLQVVIVHVSTTATMLNHSHNGQSQICHPARHNMQDVKHKVSSAIWTVQGLKCKADSARHRVQGIPSLFNLTEVCACCEYIEFPKFLL